MREQSWIGFLVFDYQLKVVRMIHFDGLVQCALFSLVITFARNPAYRSPGHNVKYVIFIFNEFNPHR